MHAKQEIYWHFRNDDYRKFKSLLKIHPKLLNDTFQDDETLLHDAVFRRDYNWVEKLLSLGAETDIPDKMGDYPLATALRHTDKKSVKQLVDAGANVNEVNERKEEGLEFSVSHNSLVITKLLINNGAQVKRYTSVIDSISTSEMVKLLTDNKHIFNEEGLEYWEEQKLALLLKTYTESGTNNE